MRRRLQFESLDKRLCFAFGDLDAEFAGQGTHTVSYERTFNQGAYNQGDSVHDILAVPGGYLIASTSYPGSGEVLTLTKVSESGMIDESFGTSGHAYVIDPEVNDFDQTGITRLANGNILVDQWSQYHGSIWSLKADGSIEREFGDEGVLRLGFFPASFDHAITAIDDGFFLVTSDVSRQTSITKYKSNGTVDASYGVNGNVSDHTAYSHTPITYVSPDGTLTVASLNKSRLELYRLRPDGSPDDSFGIGGRAKDPNGAPTSRLFFSPDGQAVYSTAMLWYGTIIVRKYKLDARPDLTFGIDGTVAIPLSTDVLPQPYVDLLIEPDGSVNLGTAAFSSVYRAPSMLITIKLTPSGSLDPTFGESGIVKTEGNVALYMPIFQDNEGGRFWARSGSSPSSSSPRVVGFVVTRTLADGTLDTGWGDNGSLFRNTTPPSQMLDYLQLQQLDGRIRLHSGWPMYGPDGLRSGVAETFDSSGILLSQAPFGTLNAFQNGVTQRYTTSAKSADGGWYLAEVFSNTIELWKFASDGSVELAFGNQGVLRMPAHQNAGLYLRTVADGALTLVQTTDPSSDDAGAMILRLDPQGNLDENFGDGGILYATGKPGKVLDVLLDGAHTVLVYKNSRTSSVTLERISSDGTIDRGFGTNGLTHVPNGLEWKAGTIDALGRIFAVVGAPNAVVNKLQLLSVDTSGEVSLRVDNGQSVLPFEYNYVFDNVRIAAHEQMIIVAATHRLSDSVIRVAGFNSQGQPWVELGDRGYRDYDLAPDGEEVQDLVINDDGTVWLAATARTGFDRVGKLLKLEASHLPALHNGSAALDVNGDSHVSAIDALYVISVLNGASPVAGTYPDTTADGEVTALDALLIINQINAARSSMEGEELQTQEPHSTAMNLEQWDQVAYNVFDELEKSRAHILHPPTNQ